MCSAHTHAHIFSFGFGLPGCVIVYNEYTALSLFICARTGDRVVWKLHFLEEKGECGVMRHGCLVTLASDRVLNVDDNVLWNLQNYPTRTRQFQNGLASGLQLSLSFVQQRNLLDKTALLVIRQNIRQQPVASCCTVFLKRRRAVLKRCVQILMTVQSFGLISSIIYPEMDISQQAPVWFCFHVTILDAEQLMLRLVQKCFGFPIAEIQVFFAFVTSCVCDCLF